MTKFMVLVVVCLGATLGAAGCGGDDDDQGGDSAPPAETTQGDGAETGSGGGGTTVGMKDIQFEPTEISVGAGETITFSNDETVPHDVHKTSGPGKEFASGPPGGMQEGDTYELTLKQPGTYEYVCEVHAPGMAGTITVK